MKARRSPFALQFSLRNDRGEPPGRTVDPQQFAPPSSASDVAELVIVRLEASSAASASEPPFNSTSAAAAAGSALRLRCCS